MLKHTFLDKCSTIYKDSEINTGLNPVMELNYGIDVSRVLIHFDLSSLISYLEENSIDDVENMSHVLKLTNCSSVNNDVHAILSASGCNIKKRASSFDIILFTVPKDWDAGKGVDFQSDFWVNGNRVVSTDGCNWYQRVNGGEWDEPGIYSNKSLSLAYDAFSSGEESVIIARQHFDIGNENFEFDITDYVNAVIKGERINHGLCLAFSPMTELSQTEEQQYVGFFGPFTHTIFKPYLETRYDDAIKDDRDSFQLNKKNRLYLYVSDSEGYTDLDETPTCSLEEFPEMVIPVYHQKKGVYFAEFALSSKDVSVDSILTDKWQNLVKNGEDFDDVLQEFNVQPSSLSFSGSKSNNKYKPSIEGISFGEKMRAGEIRNLDVKFRKMYSTNEYKTVSDAFYWIYTKDGQRDLMIYDYQPIEKLYLKNRIIIDTSDYMPGDYFIGIRWNNQYFRDITSFTIVSDVEKRYI